jgi:hypothetical protein
MPGQRVLGGMTASLESNLERAYGHCNSPQFGARTVAVPLIGAM